MTDKPEVWGNGCECWVTPRHTHYVYYGATEPGSACEFNPDCPMHGVEILCTEDCPEDCRVRSLGDTEDDDE